MKVENDKKKAKFEKNQKLKATRDEARRLKLQNEKLMQEYQALLKRTKVIKWYNHESKY